MKCWLLFSVALATAGCATEPMTPEQQEYLRQWSLEQQRHTNEMQRDAWNSMRPLPPVQLAQPVAPAMQLTNRALATWTGQSRPATSVTGLIGFNCEYLYAGQRFWQMHAGACPSSVWVQ